MIGTVLFGVLILFGLALNSVVWTKPLPAQAMVRGEAKEMHYWDMCKVMMLMPVTPTPEQVTPHTQLGTRRHGVSYSCPLVDLWVYIRREREVAYHSCLCVCISGRFFLMTMAGHSTTPTNLANFPPSLLTPSLSWWSAGWVDLSAFCMQPAVFPHACDVLRRDKVTQCMHS